MNTNFAIRASGHLNPNGRERKERAFCGSALIPIVFIVPDRVRAFF
jgi:hypothetical protein